jgi:hypothetical protein
MTAKPAPLSLPQLCWGRWRAAPDGVWKAPSSPQEVGAASLAVRGVALAAGRGDGRAAALSPILTEVRAGAASEHDESGNDALARGAQSSDRRAWVSRSSLFRRTHYRRASARHRAHPCGNAGDLKRNSEQARPWAETSQAPLKARDDVRVTGLSFEQRATPHPSLRATFPSGAGEGQRPSAARVR